MRRRTLNAWNFKASSTDYLWLKKRNIITSLRVSQTYLLRFMLAALDFKIVVSNLAYGMDDLVMSKR
jgi:hypothetical protein